MIVHFESSCPGDKLCAPSVIYRYAEGGVLAVSRRLTINADYFCVCLMVIGTYEATATIELLAIIVEDLFGSTVHNK